MNNLLLSGKTMSQWDIDDILNTKTLSTKDQVERIQWYNNDNYIGPKCDGLTYLEIEHLKKFCDDRYK